MAECGSDCGSSVGDVLNKIETAEDDRNLCHVNSVSSLARRPLSDSSIKYEENAFQDSADVILVHFSERRNSSSSPGTSDGDTSDEVDESSTSNARTYPSSSFESDRSFGVRSRNGTTCNFACDCKQSQKAKRKAASKLVNVATVGFPVPVAVPSTSMRKSGNHGSRGRDSLSFIGKVKRWFGESSSPIHFEENQTSRWPRSTGSLTKSKGTQVVSLSRSSKKELQKKERRYLIRDILALTNCSYYWGKINRHEAEELLNGKPDGTFLLRDSAHKDHLFSVSFRRYNKTLHARIEQWDHKYSFDRESPTAFYSVTIKGLLAHYSIGEYCMFFEPMLVKPLYRTEPQPLMSLCRGVIASRTCYEDVNELPIPTTLKTYLFEYNYCIKPKSKKDDPDGRRKRNSTLCLF